MKYTCELCGYIYDESAGDTRQGILPGTAFCELPEYFDCPGCGYGKEAFNPASLARSNLLKTQSHSRISVRK